MDIVVTLLIGLVAGWIAGSVMGGKGGLVRNLVIGLLGAVLASVALPQLGVSLPIGDPLLHSIVAASLGAIAVLFVVQVLSK